MSLPQIVILALVQGVTEFLPVSSSGHDYLVLLLTGWAEQRRVMVVAVHVGTLGAVAIYFWRDLWAMVSGLGRAVRGQKDAGARLAALVVIATVPVVIAGAAVEVYLGDRLENLTVIAWATFAFGIVLYVADKRGMTVRRAEHLNVGDALFIGLAQALALIPGTSRAGITMAAGRLLGMERAEAARFSMLLSIPSILGAGTLIGIRLHETGDAGLTLAAVYAAALAFVAALLAISVLMAWLRRATFTPFVIYRVVLGAVLLALVYGTAA